MSMFGTKAVVAAGQMDMNIKIKRFKEKIKIKIDLVWHISTRIMYFVCVGAISFKNQLCNFKSLHQKKTKTSLKVWCKVKLIPVPKRDDHVCLIKRGRVGERGGGGKWMEKTAGRRHKHGQSLSPSASPSVLPQSTEPPVSDPSVHTERDEERHR